MRIVRRIAEGGDDALERELESIGGDALGAVGRESRALRAIPVEVGLLELVQLECLSKLSTQLVLRCLELDDAATGAPELGSHLLAGGTFVRAQDECVYTDPSPARKES